MCDSNIEKEERKNPFFEPYDTLHDTVPFDRIRMEDFEEAFMEGIRRYFPFILFAKLLIYFHIDIILSPNICCFFVF